MEQTWCGKGVTGLELNERQVVDLMNATKLVIGIIPTTAERAGVDA